MRELNGFLGRGIRSQAVGGVFQEKRSKIMGTPDVWDSFIGDLHSGIGSANVALKDVHRLDLLFRATRELASPPGRL